MSTVFMPGDVRTTSIARESHARPAAEASAAHVNGTQVISQNAPKPVTKAHKAYQTEKERKKGDKSKARDLLNKPAVVGLSGQRVHEILALMKHHSLDFLAILDKKSVLKGIFERHQFLEYAYRTEQPKKELEQEMVDNFLTVARTSVDTETDIVTLVRQFASQPHSWLPVFDLEKSLFFGLLSQKDLLLFLDQNRNLDIWI